MRTAARAGRHVFSTKPPFPIPMPSATKWFLHPLMLVFLRYGTAKRLKALAAFLSAQPAGFSPKSPPSISA